LPDCINGNVRRASRTFLAHVDGCAARVLKTEAAENRSCHFY
jgi:hypothetical protein